MAAQQGPEGLGMALHPGGAADDQHRVVQHPHRPLGLGRKVDVAGGVQPGDGRPPRREQRLLGEDGDAPGPLEAVGVQEGVLVVHPAQPADGPGAVEHRLGQGGLARVDVGQHPHHQPLGCVCHGCGPPYRKPAMRPAAVMGSPTMRLASRLQSTRSSSDSSS